MGLRKGLVHVSGTKGVPGSESAGSAQYHHTHESREIVNRVPYTLDALPFLNYPDHLSNSRKEQLVLRDETHPLPPNPLDPSSTPKPIPKIPELSPLSTELSPKAMGAWINSYIYPRLLGLSPEQLSP